LSITDLANLIRLHSSNDPIPVPGKKDPARCLLPVIRWHNHVRVEKKFQKQGMCCFRCRLIKIVNSGEDIFISGQHQNKKSNSILRHLICWRSQVTLLVDKLNDLCELNYKQGRPTLAHESAGFWKYIIFGLKCCLSDPLKLIYDTLV
jgi:hypothetical protein